MPEQEQQARQVAYKVPIVELLNNPFIQQEGWNPNYVQIKDKQVSRVNIIATVIEKQITESLATLTLDDSTGSISVRAFNEDTKKVININIGDPVLLIGRPRKYNEQIFINLEIIRKVSSEWTKVRKLDLKKEFNILTEPSKNRFTDNENLEPSSQNNSTNQYGEKILDLIKKTDFGDGADLNQVISQSGLKEADAQTLLTELIKLGEIYEPKPNKVKILG